MAKIFKEYLIHRPNWIRSWEKESNISIIDNNEKWQIRLWIEIIKNIKKNNRFNYNFTDLFYFFKTLIKEKKIKKHFFPNRIFIISSFSLNSVFINIFKKISLYINVYFLYITPCKNYVFDSTKDKKKYILNDSLIKLWGEYEKIYTLNIINSKNVKIVNCFKKNKKNNLLNNIKNDFFEYNPIKINKIKKKDFCSQQIIQFL